MNHKVLYTVMYCIPAVNVDKILKVFQEKENAEVHVNGAEV